MPYRPSALAGRDLEEIWSYVAEDASPATGDRLIHAIIDRFELLAEQPRTGRLRPEWHSGWLSQRLHGQRGTRAEQQAHDGLGSNPRSYARAIAYERKMRSL